MERTSKKNCDILIKEEIDEESGSSRSQNNGDVCIKEEVKEETEPSSPTSSCVIIKEEMEEETISNGGLVHEKQEEELVFLDEVSTSCCFIIKEEMEEETKSTVLNCYDITVKEDLKEEAMATDMIANTITIWELPSSEEDAVRYFQKFQLIPSSKVCERGHDMHIDKTKQWRCYRRDCRKNISLRNGTFLEGSRISILTALKFLYSWAHSLTSIEWGKKQLKMCNKTVVEWNKFMRDVCAHYMIYRSNKKIGGPGKIVEIDESLQLKRKNHLGRVLPEQWMLGGICRETDECFIVKIPDRNATTLLECIKNNIEEGSTIFSDCWKGYNSQQLRDANYEHFKVNHRYNFIDSESGAHTQNIERLWGSAKWRNKKHRGTARQYLDSYLCEFLWRRVHKKEDPFVGILNSMRLFSPLQ